MAILNAPSSVEEWHPLPLPALNISALFFAIPFTHMAKPPTDDSMSFGDHLEELRRRVTWALLVPIPVMIVAFWFSETMLDGLLTPLFLVLRGQGLPESVTALGPAETLFTQFKLSIIAGFVIGFPWILWQAWRFVSPGLYQHERRFVYLLLPGSAVMSVLGVLLTYFVMLPFMLHVLVAVGASMTINLPPAPVDPRVQEIVGSAAGTPVVTYLGNPPNPAPGTMWLSLPEQRLRAAVAGPDGAITVLEVPAARPPAIAQQYRLSEYVNFALLLLLGMVLAFQMPLVVMLLGWVGLVSPQVLRTHRRHALFITAVLAAIITPTSDPLSLVITWLPLYGLYELGLLLLVLAPASAVAEGRVFRWPVLRRGWNAADKPLARKEQSARPAQPERTIPREKPAQRAPAAARTDGGEGDE